MKKVIFILSVIIVLTVVGVVLLFKAIFNPNNTPTPDPTNNIQITKEKAYEGVNKYCHEKYDWSVAKDNPEIMYVTTGEDTAKEYLIIFRSYTGAYINFYVSKTDGKTRIIETAPNIDEENDLGTIDIKDYLK